MPYHGNNLLVSSTGQPNSNTYPWCTERHLNAQMRDILHRSFARSTMAVYHTGVKRFVSFCDKHHIQPLPASKQTLVYFAVSLAPSTIGVYINAVGAIHRKHGLADPTDRNKQLNLVIRGIRWMRPLHLENQSLPPYWYN